MSYDSYNTPNSGTSGTYAVQEPGLKERMKRSICEKVCSPSNGNYNSTATMYNNQYSNGRTRPHNHSGHMGNGHNDDYDSDSESDSDEYCSGEEEDYDEAEAPPAQSTYNEPWHSHRPRGHKMNGSLHHHHGREMDGPYGVFLDGKVQRKQRDFQSSLVVDINNADAFHNEFTLAIGSDDRARFKKLEEMSERNNKVKGTIPTKMIMEKMNLILRKDSETNNKDDGSSFKKSFVKELKERLMLRCKDEKECNSYKWSLIRLCIQHATSDFKTGTLQINVEGCEHSFCLVRGNTHVDDVIGKSEVEVTPQFIASVLGTEDIEMWDQIGNGVGLKSGSFITLPCNTPLLVSHINSSKERPERLGVHMREDMKPDGMCSIPVDLYNQIKQEAEERVENIGKYVDNIQSLSIEVKRMSGVISDEETASLVVKCVLFGVYIGGQEEKNGNN